jgi:hypothetical protein
MLHCILLEADCILEIQIKPSEFVMHSGAVCKLKLRLRFYSFLREPLIVSLLFGACVLFRRPCVAMTD